MKRRNFVIGAALVVGTIKALYEGARKGFDSKKDSSIFNVPDNASEIIYLKRGAVIKLPDNPEPIESLIHFNLTHYRFGKSPIILSNGHKIEGLNNEKIVVAKEPRFKKNHTFAMQYTGQDVGWILLA